MMKTEGEKLIELARAAGTPAVANAALNELIVANDIDIIKLEAQVAEAFAGVLTNLGIDTENDHNTQGTAARVAKMYVREVFKGRYLPPPTITAFPNVKGVKDMFTLGPIQVRSACSHHMVPIIGHAWVGIIPGEEVMGISKYHRIVDHVMSRPQIQEEAVELIVEQIQDLCKTENVAVAVRATHMCMTWRGVNADQNSTMVSSSLHGDFLKPAVRSEFFNIIKGQNF